MNEHKVLIISYGWPPMEGVGVVRAMKFAKYLPGHGWRPLILTVKADELTPAESSSTYPKNIKVFRTEYKDVIGDIKKLFYVTSADNGNTGTFKKRPQLADGKRNSLTSFVRELVTIPDDEKGWYKFAVRDGKKILDEERVDLIFSTSPPETAHMIARRLKRCSRIPWVADLRDLWADDHFRQRPSFKKNILRFIEKNVLKDADSLITVSEPWAEKIRTSMGSSMRDIKVIENGYDDEDFKSLAYRENKKFTLTYTGKLHKAHQGVDILFKALSNLVKEGRIDRNKIDVKFYILGYDRPDITNLAVSYDLADIVKELGKVDYNKSLEVQRSSDVLLFVQWMGPGGEGWYSAKLYDYIGARRPILALAQQNSVATELITKTSSGIIAYTEASLQEVLLNFYDEYVESGRVEYKGDEGGISKYTRDLRTKELANLFDSLVAARQ